MQVQNNLCYKYRNARGPRFIPCIGEKLHEETLVLQKLDEMDVLQKHHFEFTFG